MTFVTLRYQPLPRGRGVDPAFLGDLGHISTHGPFEVEPRVEVADQALISPTKSMGFRQRLA